MTLLQLSQACHKTGTRLLMEKLYVLGIYLIHNPTCNCVIYALAL